MSHPEKVALLAYFVENHLHLKAKAEQKKVFEDATSMLSSHELSRNRTNTIVCDRHIYNYFNYYAKPFANDGKAFPYLRNQDKTPTKHAQGKPMYNDNVIMR